MAFPPKPGGESMRVPVKILYPVVALLALVFVITCTSFAQLSTDDVHGVPRSLADNPEKPATSIDPALQTHTAPIKKDVDLVLVPVTITDQMDRLITGLDKDNFQLFEGKQQQDIKHFSTEDAPVSVGIIFDNSGSMAEKIQRAREAVMEFCKTANPQDEFFMITFSDTPALVADFSNNPDEIQNRLVFASPKGRTSLLDAIYLGMHKMKQAKNQKKALLIISDGGDNHSRYTEGEIKSEIKEGDVMVYAIGI